MMQEKPLDKPIQFLQGVGERRADVLRGIGVHVWKDLFSYYPRRYLDRSTILPISQLQENGEATTVIGVVRSAGVVHGRAMRLEAVIEDEHGGRLKCVWFRGVQWVSRLFTKGTHVALHGKVQRYGSTLSMSHPDFDLLDTNSANLATGRIVALYPGGAALQKMGLSSKVFRRLIHNLFKDHGLELEESFPDWLVEKYNLLEGRVALRAIHFPKNQGELKRARHRLIFEELFYIQLLLATTREKKIENASGIILKDIEGLSQHFVNKVLPFTLTDAQERAIQDIKKDTTSGYQMSRLIQGDVGSGKTVVAIAAMLSALDNGYQSAFMAPTEILAEQHFASLKQYLEPLGINVQLLVGKQRKKHRAEILEAVASGEAQIVVGTHAILEDQVVFKNIGMTIIDEQHRFGVMQRSKMFKKGVAPHMLLMTATPIPRSLAMTLYGDLDVTIMDEKPANRKPIITHIRGEKRRGEVYAFLKDELRAGRQVYVVYPLVEESEKLDLKDAESGFEKLTKLFRPYKVGMVHGRLQSYEKEEEMDKFKAGETDILVSTTVIEVGVDAPNASVMMIEHAERFGLSQLHQLRGRVGRSGQQSYCMLMAGKKVTQEGRARLAAMESTDDGFKISEMDLKLRGAGDFFGTRQSGLPDLKIADIARDIDILTQAREAAFNIIEKDPHLREDEHKLLREEFLKVAPKGLGFSSVG